MPKSKSWTSKIEKDGDDFVIVLPDEAMQELGWTIDDELTVTVVADGSIVVARVAPNADGLDPAAG